MMQTSWTSGRRPHERLRRWEILPPHRPPSISFTFPDAASSSLHKNQCHCVWTLCQQYKPVRICNFFLKKLEIAFAFFLSKIRQIICKGYIQPSEGVHWPYVNDIYPCAYRLQLQGDRNNTSDLFALTCVVHSTFKAILSTQVQINLSSYLLKLE